MNDKHQIIDRFNNIIFMYSTLGFEAISRKKKLQFFLQNMIYILTIGLVGQLLIKKDTIFFWVEIYFILKSKEF